MRGKAILGSLAEDLSFFYGLSTVLLASVLFVDSVWENPAVALVVFLLVDSGHVYTTVFRTYFRRSELQRSRRYVVLPAALFLLFFTWVYLGRPYLWRFVIYFTLYHHIRQYAGVFLWYARLEDFKVRGEVRHLYALVVIPLLLFHFREVDYQGLYHASEFEPWGSLAYYDVFFCAFAVYGASQVLRMFWLFTTEKVGAGLALSFVYPVALHFICFLLLEHSYEIFLPLMAIHGLTYLALIARSMARLSAPGARSLYRIWLLILAVVVGFNLLENLVTENFDVFLDSEALRGNWLKALLVSAMVTPNVLHYVLDSYLWRNGHPDFKAIMARGD